MSETGGSPPATGPGAAAKAAIVAALVVAVALAAWLGRPAAGPPEPSDGAGPGAEAPLPRLVELGGSTCTMCKMMEPVLEEIKAECAGRLRIDRIDVIANPAEKERYSISVIPAQIFYAPDGSELLRHEGYVSKDDILAAWRDLGYDLGAPAEGPVGGGAR